MSPSYALAFEEHLDPIKKRGKVVLDGAIPEGASIQVIRKTPIETEFLAQALKPLPTEALEHALDKICYIQQEIEGHLCDCRGVDWPPPGVVGPPGEGEPPGGSDAPECQPYSCDAFVQSAIDAGMEATLFPEIQIETPAFDNTGFLQSSAGSVSTTCRIIDSWKGQPIGTATFDQYFHYDRDAGAPDLCGDIQRGLGVSSNHQSTTDNEARLKFAPNNSGFSCLLNGGVYRSPSGKSIYSRKTEVTWYGSKDPGDPIGNYTGDFGSGVNVENTGEIKGGITGLHTFIASPAWTAPCHFHVECHFGDPYVDPVWDNYWGWIYYIRAEVTTAVYINGVGSSLVQVVDIGASYQVEPTIVSVDHLWSNAFSGTKAHLYGIAFSDEMPDVEDAYLWYQRNFENYEPPAYCQFSGAEI